MSLWLSRKQAPVPDQLVGLAVHLLTLHHCARATMKNVGLLVDLGDGWQEGAFLEILVERQKCFIDLTLWRQFNRPHHDS